MMGLTPRMRELLVYIQTRELCPSYDEMRKALGAESKSVVQRLLSGLEERGYIRRLPTRARAIEVIRPILPTVEIRSERYLYLSNHDRRVVAGLDRGRS